MPDDNETVLLQFMHRAQNLRLLPAEQTVQFTQPDMAALAQECMEVSQHATAFRLQGRGAGQLASEAPIRSVATSEALCKGFDSEHKYLRHSVRFAHTDK